MQSRDFHVRPASFVAAEEAEVYLDEAGPVELLFKGSKAFLSWNRSRKT